MAGVPSGERETAGVAVKERKITGVAAEERKITEVTAKECGESGVPERTTGVPVEASDHGEVSGTNENEDDLSEGVKSKHQEIPGEDVYHSNSMTPSVQRVYELRPNRVREYSHLHANIVHHALT